MQRHVHKLKTARICVVNGLKTSDRTDVFPSRTFNVIQRTLDQNESKYWQEAIFVRDLFLSSPWLRR